MGDWDLAASSHVNQSTGTVVEERETGNVCSSTIEPKALEEGLDRRIRFFSGLGLVVDNHRLLCCDDLMVIPSHGTFQHT